MYYSYFDDDNGSELNRGQDVQDAIPDKHDKQTQTETQVLTP